MVISPQFLGLFLFQMAQNAYERGLTVADYLLSGVILQAAGQNNGD